MAKIIINVRDDIKSNTGSCTEEIYSAIQSGVLIPTNATNGDVIKTMFPNAIIYDAGIVVNVEFSENEENWYDKKWWNAPYKAESEA